MQRTPPTGRRAVIVGNGPSVDAMPSGFWTGAQSNPDCMLIGTNRALCIIALQGVRFAAMCIRDRYTQLWVDQQLGWQYHADFWKPFTGWKVGPAFARHAHCDEFVRMSGPWQHERVIDHNREAVVMANHSVVLMAANWAWLQGARDIALVGVDYGPGPDGQLHAAMPSPWGQAGRRGQEVYKKQIPDCTVLECRNAAAAVAAAGGRIVNVSPGTRLKAVPTCDAMEWIGNERLPNHAKMSVPVCGD